VSGMKAILNDRSFNAQAVELFEPVGSDDLSRFEGEGGSQAPEPAAERIDAPLEQGLGRRHRRAADETKSIPVSNESRDLRVRKQVYELTLHDLNTFPIWEFRLDEEDGGAQDESTVRPCIVTGPLDPADRMFVVRAVFTLADGSRMRGYITPPGRGDAGVGTLQPIIVTEHGQVRFWCGTAAPGPKRLAQSYELLGKEAKRIFPLRFESEVELAGGPVRNSVPGFLVMEDFQTRRTRTVV